MNITKDATAGKHPLSLRNTEWKKNKYEKAQLLILIKSYNSHVGKL